MPLASEAYGLIRFAIGLNNLGSSTFQMESKQILPWDVPMSRVVFGKPQSHGCLGLAMTMEDKEDMVSEAKALNPEISIFQAGRDANTKLTINRI